MVTADRNDTLALALRDWLAAVPSDHQSEDDLRDAAESWLEAAPRFLVRSSSVAEHRPKSKAAGSTPATGHLRAAIESLPEHKSSGAECEWWCDWDDHPNYEHCSAPEQHQEEMVSRAAVLRELGSDI